MNDLDFEFEPSAWELTIETLKSGDSLSASRFLTLLEGEDDAQAEIALDELSQRRITLDICDLPQLSCDGEAAQRLNMEKQLVQLADMRKGLDENDPLRLYLEELASIPVAGDPELLAAQILQGSEAAVSKLVGLQLSRVVDLSREYVGRGVLLLDLIQEGSLGLWQGLQQYSGGDIDDYCTWWIRQFMAGAVTMQARSAGVGQKLRRAMEDYRDTDHRLLAELGRNPTLEELAQALHMTPQQTMIVAETLDNAQLLQRAKAPQAPQQEQEDDQAVEDTAYFQMRQRIEELLSVLPAQDAELLTLRYGLEGGLPMKPQQVAVKLGISAEEVTAREAAALAKLRQEQ